MQPESNILLMRLKSMGDVVFTLPSVHLLRASFPRSRISFLVSAENAPLLEGFREVDETIVLDRSRYRGGNPFHIVGDTFALIRRLRRSGFSLVVDFQGYGETAWLARLSGAPQRWACVHATPRRWAYTRTIRYRNRVHPIDCYLSLLHEGGLGPGTVRNEFVLPETALAEARRFFAEQRLALDRPTLLIQPFTSTVKKSWPLNRYGAVARHWRERGRQVVFGGGPGERAALEPMRQAGFAVSAGVPLLVSAGLAKLSALTLAGDTGLLHLATAMGKRTVGIIRSTAPGNKYPYPHPEWAVTPPAGLDVRTIETDAVIAMCERALTEAPTGDAAPNSR
jgi:ADP-heptose:LPS heptosyltransferase